MPRADETLVGAQHGNTVNQFAVAVVKGSNIYSRSCANGVLLSHLHSTAYRLHVRADFNVCLK